MKNLTVFAFAVALVLAGCVGPQQKIDMTKLSDEDLIRRKAFLDDQIRDLEIEQQGSYSTQGRGMGGAAASGFSRGFRQHDLDVYRGMRTDVVVEQARREKVKP